jgi:hypothetical protein
MQGETNLRLTAKSPSPLRAATPPFRDAWNSQNLSPHAFLLPSSSDAYPSAASAAPMCPHASLQGSLIAPGRGKVGPRLWQWQWSSEAKSWPRTRWAAARDDETVRCGLGGGRFVDNPNLLQALLGPWVLQEASAAGKPANHLGERAHLISQGVLLPPLRPAPPQHGRGKRVCSLACPWAAPDGCLRACAAAALRRDRWAPAS